MGDAVQESEPIATLITLRNEDDLAALTGLHPGTDFLIPARYQSAVALAPHAIAPAGRDYFFLIARQRAERTTPPAWACHL